VSKTALLPQHLRVTRGDRYRTQKRVANHRATDLLSLRLHQVSFSPSRRAKGGLLAQPPLGDPPGTRLRGPSGSLRCSG